MPERLDRVTIAFGRGDVILSWDTRQALMARLQHVKSTARIRASFEAVGATRAVGLSMAQRTFLLRMLEDWSLGRDGYEAMPADLFELRNALIDDLQGVHSGCKGPAPAAHPNRRGDMSGGDETQQARLARNQSIFRDANEGIELAAESTSFPDPIPFFCECPLVECTEIVRLTMLEYEDIRAIPVRFFTAPGHYAPSVAAGAATVVEESQDFAIVDKIGVAADVAEDTYPAPVED
jgi:hypothetical protein